MDVHISKVRVPNDLEEGLQPSRCSLQCKLLQGRAELKAGGCFRRDVATEESNREQTEKAQWHGEVQGARQWDNLLLCQEVKMRLAAAAFRRRNQRPQPVQWWLYSSVHLWVARAHSGSPSAAGGGRGR